MRLFLRRILVGVGEGRVFFEIECVFFGKEKYRMVIEEGRVKFIVDMCG